ncbi:MAG: hypothetical protein QME66_04605 [Candidatus Eisenbacteria bacterium]|nr:hypothetical protein [Candidatus Eisenbacteria bacterium]
MARITLPEPQEQLGAHQKSEMDVAALELVVSMLLSSTSTGSSLDQILAGPRTRKEDNPRGDSWPL